MTILLSGATGFLGRALVASAPGPVVALLRSQHERRAAALSRRAPVEVTGLAGDVTAPRWGLDDEALDDLRARIDLVVHAAGLVQWSAPWPDLMAQNVIGAREAVRVADALDCPLVHVSSLFCARREDGRVPERLADEHPDLTKYERSKCRSEWAVADATAATGGRALIVRIGALSGDLHPDHRGRADLTKPYFIRLIEAEGLSWLPVGQDATLDITPRDVAAAALWDLRAEIPGAGVAVRHVSYGDEAPLVGAVLAEARHRRVFSRDIRVVQLPPAALRAGSRLADRFASGRRADITIGARYFASTTTYETGAPIQPPPASRLAETLSPLPARTSGALPAFYTRWL